MIDIATEQLIALADVPKHLPECCGGKRVSLSCVYRWAQRGLRWRPARGFAVRRHEMYQSACDPAFFRQTGGRRKWRSRSCSHIKATTARFRQGQCGIG